MPRRTFGAPAPPAALAGVWAGPASARAALAFSRSCRRRRRAVGGLLGADLRALLGRGAAATAALRARSAALRSFGVDGAAGGGGSARPRAASAASGVASAASGVASAAASAVSTTSTASSFSGVWSAMSKPSSGRCRAGARRSGRGRASRLALRRPAVFSSSPVACWKRRPKISRRAVLMCSTSSSSVRSRISLAFIRPGRPLASRTSCGRAACGRPGGSPRGRAARARRPARTSRGPA